MRRFYVVTPEYGTVIPILDAGTGPMEYGSDVVEIEAENRRDALVLGLKLLTEQNSRWVEEARSDGVNPFNGLKVEEIED